jgi:hypothetical protein
MYYLTKIFQTRTDHMPGVETRHYSEAFDLSHQAMKQDNNIVSMLIFSDKDTAIVIKRRTNESVEPST